MGGAAGVLPFKAVKKTHNPFNHGNVGTGGHPRKRINDPLFPHHIRVKVPRRPPADGGVMGRVDKVRADFERLNREPRFHERGHQCSGDGSFAASAVGAGDDDGGNH